MPSDGSIWDVYRDEMLALGKPDPGPYVGGDTSAFHLAHDVEQAWEEYAPFALHEVNAYGAWMASAGIGARGRLRDHGRRRRAPRHRAVPGAHARRPGAEIRAKGEFGFTIFHPMAGGVPPAMAWESLHLFEHEVLPQLGAGDAGIVRGGSVGPMLFINGEWRDAASGATFDSRNPATGEVIGQAADAGVADVHAAIEAADAAFGRGRPAPRTSGRRTSPRRTSSCSSGARRWPSS